MSQTVNLPEQVWSALQQAALASGVTPAVWIAEHLPVPADFEEVVARVHDELANDLEPPTYKSVPLDRTGHLHVECLYGKKVLPLPYSLKDFSE